MRQVDFKPIFHPDTIAVIGASNDPTKFGGRTYFMIRDRGHAGKLYAVNPKAGDIDGQAAYKRVQDIPGDVEMAIIAVAAPYVVQAVADCAEKGVRAVQILTAGFKETGSEQGAQWEDQMAEIARSNGMRIVGPNCFGIYSPGSALSVLPGPDFPNDSGPVGVLSQSGGFTSFLVRKAMGLGIRFSKVISYGNACDLNECDYLSYFEQDEQTKIVVAYIEGVRDGRRFFDIVKRISRKKPVILWKGGLTELGSKAVASHTASLGGSQAIWDGFFRQTGAVPTAGIDAIIDLMVAFQCLQGFKGRRVSAISGGGAITVAASDALDPVGLSIPQFSDETREAIRMLLPPSGNTVGNPLDTGPPIFLFPNVGSILEAVAASDRIDIAIVQHEVSAYLPVFMEEMAEIVPSVQDSSGKPFAVTMPAPTLSSDTMDIEEARRKYREFYIKRGVAVFETFETAVTTLAKVIRYNEYVAERTT